MLQNVFLYGRGNGMPVIQVYSRQFPIVSRWYAVTVWVCSSHVKKLSFMLLLSCLGCVYKPLHVSLCVCVQVKLVQHTYSCLFGTFLCNSGKEREDRHVQERTCSVWSLLRPANRTLRNMLYSSHSETVRPPSVPKCSVSSSLGSGVLLVLLLVVLVFHLTWGNFKIMHLAKYILKHAQKLFTKPSKTKDKKRLEMLKKMWN